MLQGIALCEVTKHDTPEVEVQREAAGLLSHARGGKRDEKAKRTGMAEHFTCHSAVRHQWKLMGLSST